MSKTLKRVLIAVDIFSMICIVIGFSNVYLAGGNKGEMEFTSSILPFFGMVIVIATLMLILGGEDKSAKRRSVKSTSKKRVAKKNNVQKTTTQTKNSRSSKNRSGQDKKRRVS
ncbi:MAG: hypothetical protein ACRCYE_13315 [Sarcina sp.]